MSMDKERAYEILKEANQTEDPEKLRKILYMIVFEKISSSNGNEEISASEENKNKIISPNPEKIFVIHDKKTKHQNI